METLLNNLKISQYQKAQKANVQRHATAMRHVGGGELRCVRGEGCSYSVLWRTPLHVAASGGFRVTCAQLLDEGARPVELLELRDATL